LIRGFDQGVISGKIAKTIFEEMAASSKPPRQIVEEKGLVQISDSTAIEEIVAKILASHSAEVAAYKSGKTKLLGFFVGQVMQATRGQANPKLVNEILKKKLAG
jgi:aspartyl-tRNA(Asn)/glutamyl-tRNA(Gln) amidotransferase subunit B